MVGHKGIGIERKGIAFAGTLEGGEKDGIIGGRAIDDVAIIAASHQVIKQPWAWIRG